MTKANKNPSSGTHRHSNLPPSSPLFRASEQYWTAGEHDDIIDQNQGFPLVVSEDSNAPPPPSNARGAAEEDGYKYHSLLPLPRSSPVKTDCHGATDSTVEFPSNEPCRASPTINGVSYEELLLYCTSLSLIFFSHASQPRLSVLLQWPQRSPIKAEHDDADESSSFVLLTQSFDTISETDASLRPSPEKARPPSASPTTKLLSDMRKTISPRPKLLSPPTRIALRHLEDSDLGNISPIRFEVQRPVRFDSPPSARKYHPDSRETRGLSSARRESIAHADQLGASLLVPPATNYHGYADPARLPAPQDPITSASLPESLAVLHLMRTVFDGCSYRLPCLYDDGLTSRIHLSRPSPVKLYTGSNNSPSDDDLIIALRRVESAICAFGGHIAQQQAPQQQRYPSANTIFRPRVSPEREFYNSRFHQRYILAPNNISWHVEEDPPIITATEMFEKEQKSTSNARSKKGDVDNKDERSGAENASPNSRGSVVPIDSQQKMKYRCKLCGQLKQNHNCPYQQSLQRSIAVMVYPYANAFTASEPGILTKPLSQMNNFVSYDSSQLDEGGKSPNPFASIGTSYHHEVNHVSPETSKSSRKLHHSPQASSVSTLSDTDRSTPARGIKRRHEYINHTAASLSYQQESQAYNRTLGAESHISLGPTTGHPMCDRQRTAFSPSNITLRPEHYRAVTPTNKRSSPRSDVHSSEKLSSNFHQVDADIECEYEYPKIPSSFGERKRLSDTLFFLSKDLPPSTTTHISNLLRLGRDHDEWDLCVAQVMAQVVVALYCNRKDFRLNGLQQYLLGIGISC